MTVQVEISRTLGENYNIQIENGLLAKTGEIVKGLPHLKSVQTFAIITDTNVAPLYEKTVADSLVDAGFNVIAYAFPHGEKSKSAAQFFALCNWLAENEVTRTDALIALGGGVVGDLTGFVAASYLRGVPFVQVPTTLLAMVDSSVGGKTGIDIPGGKNLVGAFKQPAAVICDPSTLKTLSPQIFSDGVAEVIKHGMIRSEKLLRELLGGDINENICEIIRANVEIKRDVVQRDELDKGERQLLNFGHTIAHAIERLSNFEVSHGSAVAIGMTAITRAAVIKGVCPQECLDILEKLLAKFNLPNEANFSQSEIYKASLSDKKRAGDTITEVIPTAVGNCELKKIPVSELTEWIMHKDIKFHELDEVADELPVCAVIVARYKNKWVFCKNRTRKWELPGGHRENGETILETAKRELWEETGATEFEITPVCAYSIRRYGLVFFAEIKKFGELPKSEIEAIDFFDDLPSELSFPMYHPKHFAKVKEILENSHNL